MRDAFHEDLDSINQTLVNMSTLVSGAMTNATKALLQPNLELAEHVIAEDDRIDAIQHELDNKTLDVMARQQPVASDLRNLVTSLRMSADFERMGDFAHHVARIARMRYPNNAVPVISMLLLKSSAMMMRWIAYIASYLKFFSMTLGHTESKQPLI